MMRLLSKLPYLLLATLLAVGTWGCVQNEPDTLGEHVEEAAEELGDAIDDATDDAKDTAEEVGENLKEAGEEVKDEVEKIDPPSS